MNRLDMVSERIIRVLADIEGQPPGAACIGPGVMPFHDQIEQIREFAEYANEQGLAIESLVCLLEVSRLQLSGPSAVSLIEAALILGFKTEREEDRVYDRRLDAAAHQR